jgi:type III restriction enzyme
MIELKPYQAGAVNGLLKETYALLKLPGARQKLIFKAPTGAGKTITMAAYLNQLVEEMPDKLDIAHHDLAFVWIAPNQLHLQSYQSLKAYFAELRSLRAIQFEDIIDGRILPNEVLFLNWQSINKEGNLYIKENENDKTLISYINQSRLHDTEIIVILDEAHLFASKGRASAELLQKIYSKIEIDVSATPFYSSDYQYTIKRQDVIEAEMIKKGVILNPDLDAYLQNNKPLNQVLLETALNKRNEIKDAYSNLGIDLNPLLLIQLPSDTLSESSLDRKIKDEVIEYLDYSGYTTSNNRLAVWLSTTKINLENIEHHDNIVDVLIFKQAIALGWDCPRACVLLIFRDLQQEEFTIQTVGRILRMPEQKHYSNSLLNYGYVYTNLSKDIIRVVTDDLDYIVQNKATRIPNYDPVNLKSYFINTRLTRNRLSSQFRKCFYDAAEEFFGVTLTLNDVNDGGLYHFNIEKLIQKFIATNVDSIVIPIPKDVLICAEVGGTVVNNMEKFAKTKSELDILFRQFCRQNVGAYAQVDSTPILELALKMFFDEYLAVSEFDAIKIVLYEQNRPRFQEVIDRARLKHEKLLEQKAAQASKRVELSHWDVPFEKIYNEYYKEIIANKHALEPFFQNKSASRPERNFIDFLQKQVEYIDWWYKNGDQNKEDFAVTYLDREGIIRGFYVDFVIKLKSGTVALFDTKTLDSDSEFINKHNALNNYISEQFLQGKNIIGGVIIEKNTDVWKYSRKNIHSSTDISEWISFDPALS